jgi:hypothetical protein
VHAHTYTEMMEEEVKKKKKLKEGMGTISQE